MTIVHPALRADILASGPETDTLDRALWRLQSVFDLFYDDERFDSDQAIRDLLTDVIHMAKERDVDLEDALNEAQSLADSERRDWDSRDELRAQNDDPPFEEHTDRMARLAEDDAIDAMRSAA